LNENNSVLHSRHFPQDIQLQVADMHTKVWQTSAVTC
jgi:hypothetical protein